MGMTSFCRQVVYKFMHQSLFYTFMDAILFLKLKLLDLQLHYKTNIGFSFRMTAKLSRPRFVLSTLDFSLSCSTSSSNNCLLAVSGGKRWQRVPVGLASVTNVFPIMLGNTLPSTHRLYQQSHIQRIAWKERACGPIPHLGTHGH